MTLEEEFREYANRNNDGEYAELIEIVKALTGMKNGTGLLKEAIELANETKNADLIRSLSKLNLEMATVESELAISKRKAVLMEAEIESLVKTVEALRHPSDEPVERNGLYYTGNGGKGPYCPRCWDENKKFIRLSTMGRAVSCSQCQFAQFTD